MKPLSILIGGESFRRLREEKRYYVDKTGMIEELLGPASAMVSLITRPRRFGKTLAMSMLREFFDIQKDSTALFEDLAIAKNTQLCNAYMNKYPTVLISLKQVEGLSFEEALNFFRESIVHLCSDYVYLVSSDKVSLADSVLLSSVIERKVDKALLANILLTLCRALHAHWGKPAILLIDEYDVPLAKAESNGYYQEMVGFLRNMLGAALKTNESLKFAVLTGCLRISKESIFTGLNNFKCFGISDVKFSDKFGFTSGEVDTLLAASGFSAKKAEMKEWYDGYRFGTKTEIYCPWDILQYIMDLQDDPNVAPQPYWNNTSGNALVRSFVGRTDLNIGDKFELLLAGSCVEASIIETLTYDSLHTAEDNLWSLLYLTGYLTKASPKQMAKCGIPPKSEKMPLVIPNREVREIFTTSIAAWFMESVQHADRTELFEYFWDGDVARLSDLLTEHLYSTISYYDAHENYYHAFLTGILSFRGWQVRSNTECGNGRPDILVLDLLRKRAVIIEIKVAGTYEGMEKSAQAALAQIEDRKYASGLPPRVTQLIKYGVAFCKKECLVLKG